MKVRAIGDSDRWVGYDGLVRRRGGDVFTLPDPKMFSSKWMEKVEEDAPESRPAHFNKIGRGDARRVKEQEAVI
jgi:hypothetical protein